MLCHLFLHGMHNCKTQRLVLILDLHSYNHFNPMNTLCYLVYGISGNECAIGTMNE